MKKKSRSKRDSVESPNFAAALPSKSDGTTAKRISNDDNVWIEKLRAVWMDMPSPRIHHGLTQLLRTAT
jgi:hypothetical protein